MKVFLSGKVDAKYGAWRDAILGVDGHWDASTRQYQRRPLWAIYQDVEWSENPAHTVAPWPEKPNLVLDHHTYVGPYRQIQVLSDSGKSTGYFHGATVAGEHGQPDEVAKRAVAGECRTALRNTDMLFAYINSPDAYGTIAEIGYAAALGKFVAIYIEPGTEFDYEDYWFVESFAAHVVSLPYRYEYVGEYTEERGEPPLAPESDRVELALKEAFVAYASQPPRQMPVVMERGSTVSAGWAREVAGSLQQITRWTSDPRVRAEVARLVERLMAS